MSKESDMLLKQIPIIFFDTNAELTLKHLKNDLLIPCIIKKYKEEKTMKGSDRDEN